MFSAAAGANADEDTSVVGTAAAAIATVATPVNGSAAVKVGAGIEDEFDDGTADEDSAADEAAVIGCSEGSDAIARGAAFESGRVATAGSDRENRAGGGATNDGNKCDDSNGDKWKDEDDEAITDVDDDSDEEDDDDDDDDDDVDDDDDDNEDNSGGRVDSTAASADPLSSHR